MISINGEGYEYCDMPETATHQRNIEFLDISVWDDNLIKVIEHNPLLPYPSEKADLIYLKSALKL